MKLSRFSSLALAAALAFGTAAAHAKPVQITDVNGRKVTVDLPAKRVVLGFYYQDYMAIGGKDALNNVVGFSKAVWSDWAPPSWAAFSKAVPKLNQLADVGEVEVGTFSVEKVLALKPDLLILADWQYKALGSDLARINKAGIPIVVLDYNAQTVAKHVQSTKLIGTLTGQQQKADKLAADYKRIADTIQARVKKANLPKPKVYVEFGNKGPAEHSFTFGKSMWGPMVTLVGGNNIAASSVEFYGPINPAKRAGWANLPAIKNNRLYAAYHANSRTLSDSASIQFMAKAIYPQLFKDFNPEKTYIDFYRQNLPVVPNGTFYLYPKGQ